MTHGNPTRVQPAARYDHTGAVTLGFPFNQPLVDALKRFPSHARRYNPESRTWTITSPYAARAVGLLLAIFPDAVIEASERRLDSQPVRSTDRAFATLHLLPSAPRPVIDAVYRVLARLAHPDAGGNAEAMLAFNAAYDEMKGRVAP
jgi:hypothetical protein